VFPENALSLRFHVLSFPWIISHNAVEEACQPGKKLELCKTCIRKVSRDSSIHVISSFRFSITFVLWIPRNTSKNALNIGERRDDDEQSLEMLSNFSFD
jgi:hypothetical protein